MKPSNTTSPSDENHRHPSSDDVPDVDPSSIVKKKKKKDRSSSQKSSSSSNKKTAKPLQTPESPAHSDDAIPPPPTTSPPSIPLERGGSSATEQQQSSTSRLRESQPLDTLAPADRDIPLNGPTSPASSSLERSVRGNHGEDDKDVERGHEGSHSRSGSTRDGSRGFSTKILLCGGSERESKRKDLQDENNPLSSNPPVSSPDSLSCVRGRKSSRKGSKKKSKEVIPLSTIEDKTARSTEGDVTLEGGEIEDSQQEGDSKEAPKNPNKSCCFCWCCCCSCSCLSVKNGKGDKETAKNEVSSLEHFFSGSDDQMPSKEEIKSWGESFDKLMKCPWGRKVFREFLKCEYSEENILFWLACEDLKNESDAEVIEEKCRIIYEDYISILSPKEVSLDSRVREIINKNMINPSKDTFAEAQLQIYTLMHRDSYPRFVNSSNYKQLLESAPDAS